MATFPNHLEGGSLGYGPTVLAHCAAQCRSAGAAASGATRTSPHRRRAGGGGARRGRSAAAWQWPATTTSPTAEEASASTASARATPATPVASPTTSRAHTGTSGADGKLVKKRKYGFRRVSSYAGRAARERERLGPSAVGATQPGAGSND